MAASVAKGDVQIDGTLTLNGTLDTNSTITFDGAVDFDAGVDLAGATVVQPTVIAASDSVVNLGNRTVASDGALTIDGTDTTIILLGSAAGAKAATITAPTGVATGGPIVNICLQAATGGSYTIACTYITTAGTLTLDAAGEGAHMCWINGVLHVWQLLGTATHA